MQDFAIATIGSGKTAHLISGDKAVCGIKGEFHHEVAAEQAHWDCKRCDNSLADAFRREALQAVQATFAEIQAELEREVEVEVEVDDALLDDQGDTIHAHDVMDQAAREFVDHHHRRIEAQRELRKSLVKEYKLTKPMQRDLALSYQTALGSKDSLLEDQALLITCHDGMTSKGLRQRGLMGEGGRNGWATEEGFALAQVMYDTEDLV